MLKKDKMVQLSLFPWVCECGEEFEYSTTRNVGTYKITRGTWAVCFSCWKVIYLDLGAGI